MKSKYLQQTNNVTVPPDPLAQLVYFSIVQSHHYLIESWLLAGWSHVSV